MEHGRPMVTQRDCDAVRFSADVAAGPMRRLPRAEVDLLRRWQRSLTRLLGSSHPAPNTFLDVDGLAAVGRARLLLSEAEYDAVMRSLN